MGHPSTSKRRSASRAIRGRPPLGNYLERRKLTSWSIVVTTSAVLICLAGMDRQGWLLDAAGDLARYDGKWFSVVRVLDGDTIDVAPIEASGLQWARGQTTRVRLWGIDTPEVARPEEGKPAQPYADAATLMTRRLCDGRYVRLHLEPHQQRGKYGRLLAYVELAEGRLMNEELLLKGLARADDRFSHRLFDRFAVMQMQAQHDKVGLWQRGQ